MTMGRHKDERQLSWTTGVEKLCQARVGKRSIYRVLATHGATLLPEELFDDLYSTRGRRSIPPRVMATVMVLQRFEGLSDVEATQRLEYDVRFKWACGLQLEDPSFDPTLLVDMRARLRDSARPNRIFDAVLDVAKQAGLVGRKRIVDSTALYDAVSTQDTVTLVRSAIVGVLRAAGELQGALRALLRRDDAYDKSGKPSCAWDDKAAREELVDALTRDANALLAELHGRSLGEELDQATKLLATVIGQDIEQGADGVFRIIVGVAPDRVISTNDPEARHGHKTSARGYDGFKAHVAIDADSGIITATDVTAANVSDAATAEGMLDDVLTPPANGESTKAEVYGDASYGSADLLQKLDDAGVEANVKVQPPVARAGMYSQDDFALDRDKNEMCCPAGVRVSLTVLRNGAREANFGVACTTCPLRSKCTDSKSGRKVKLHPKHETLDRHRKRQRQAEWKANYRATRPKVERRIAHLMRRKHGGRRARLIGCHRNRHDFAMLAAASNLARLAALGAAFDGANSVTK
jgi:transposase